MPAPRDAHAERLLDAYEHAVREIKVRMMTGWLLPGVEEQFAIATELLDRLDAALLARDAKTESDVFEAAQWRRTELANLKQQAQGRRPRDG